MPTATLPSDEDFAIAIKVAEEFNLTLSTRDLLLPIWEMFARQEFSGWQERLSSFIHGNLVCLEAALKTPAIHWFLSQPAAIRAHQSRFPDRTRKGKDKVQVDLELLEKEVERRYNEIPRLIALSRRALIQVDAEYARQGPNPRRHYSRNVPEERFWRLSLARTIYWVLRSWMNRYGLMLWLTSVLGALREYYYDKHAVRRLANAQARIEHLHASVREAKARLQDINCLVSDTFGPSVASKRNRPRWFPPSEMSLVDYYDLLTAFPTPIRRLDGTAPERLFVFRLVRDSIPRFRSPGVTAITHLFDLPGIHSPLSSRQVARLCEEYRAALMAYRTSREPSE